MCTEIDARVKVAIETEDLDLVLELRHLNKGRPGDTFNNFFEELEKLVEEETAGDERRHGISHNLLVFVTSQPKLRQNYPKTLLFQLKLLFYIHLHHLTCF